MRRLVLAAIALGVGRLVYSAVGMAVRATDEAHDAADRAERSSCEAIVNARDAAQAADRFDRLVADLESAASVIEESRDELRVELERWDGQVRDLMAMLKSDALVTADASAGVIS